MAECMNASEIRNLIKELDKMLEKNMRPEILPKPVPEYKHEFSKHPESVRLSFDDGSTAIYDLRVEQPAPVILENIKIIRRMKQGYVNQPPRRRGRK